jgi:hypothetical protein
MYIKVTILKKYTFGLFEEKLPGVQDFVWKHLEPKHIICMPTVCFEMEMQTDYLRDTNSLPLTIS